MITKGFVVVPAEMFAVVCANAPHGYLHPMPLTEAARAAISRVWTLWLLHRKAKSPHPTETSQCPETRYAESTPSMSLQSDQNPKDGCAPKSGGNDQAQSVES
jgi:hypothetical protein